MCISRKQYIQLSAYTAADRLPTLFLELQLLESGDCIKISVLASKSSLAFVFSKIEDTEQINPLEAGNRKPKKVELRISLECYSP